MRVAMCARMSLAEIMLRWLVSFAVDASRFAPETEDLSAAEPERRAELLELWLAWRAEAGEEPLGALDRETEQALRALGYLR